MGAEEVAGGGLHGFQGERPVAIPDIGGKEGGADAFPRLSGGEGVPAAFEDAVFVVFAAGGVAGVKGWGSYFGGQDTNAGGEDAVEGSVKVLGRDGGREGDGGDLGKGVDAGVGTAGTLGEDGFANDAMEGLGEGTLDRGEAGLNLPAVEAGAVVREGELPVGHCAGGNRGGKGLLSRALKFCGEPSIR